MVEDNGAPLKSESGIETGRYTVGTLEPFLKGMPAFVQKGHGDTWEAAFEKAEEFDRRQANTKAATNTNTKANTNRKAKAKT